MCVCQKDCVFQKYVRVTQSSKVAVNIIINKIKNTLAQVKGKGNRENEMK